MTLFQWFMLPALASVFFWEMVGLSRQPTGRRLRLMRGAVWAIVALAIAKPEFLQAVADLIGICRGADLVLYVFVLAFLGVSFYFQSRAFRLQGQLADVVRHLAIQNARHGGDADLPVYIDQTLQGIWTTSAPSNRPLGDGPLGGRRKREEKGCRPARPG
jgi:hypothetical protein